LTTYAALKGEMSSVRPGTGSGCWSMPSRYTNDHRSSSVCRNLS